MIKILWITNLQSTFLELLEWATMTFATGKNDLWIFQMMHKCHFGIKYYFLVLYLLKKWVMIKLQYFDDFFFPHKNILCMQTFSLLCSHTYSVLQVFLHSSGEKANEQSILWRGQSGGFICSLHAAIILIHLLLYRMACTWGIVFYPIFLQIMNKFPQVYWHYPMHTFLV